MSEPFIGQITVFGFGFPPLGWADCAGQLMPISQNTALFSLLGTFYGGDGRVTFALPDLRGRVPVGQGASPGLSDYVLGEEGGLEGVTLTASETGSHSHALQAATELGSTNSPNGNLPAIGLKGTARQGDRANIYNPGSPDATLAQNTIATVSGGGLAHNNLQPFLVLRYCIALNGIFPQRS